MQKSRRSPWPVAIAVGLGLAVLANAAFIYIALTHADQVESSYSAEQR